MATLSQIQVPANGLAVNISALAKNKTLVYAGSPGNVDQFQVLLSEDGVNYSQFVQITGPGTYSIPGATQFMKAASNQGPGWSPTMLNGITPVLYCNGTLQDDVASVTTTGTSLPLAPTGGIGPVSTNSNLDGAVVWERVESFSGQQIWVASSVYLPFSLLKVAVPLTVNPSGFNYWITLGGLTSASTIPAGLLLAQTLGTAVTDNGGSWYPVVAWVAGTTYTSASNNYVYANGAVFLCITTGAASISGTGPSGLNFDGQTAWNFIEVLGSPLPWQMSHGYAVNTLIKVPATEGGFNYWIVTISGTSATGGLPGTLAAPQTLGQTYADGGVTWTAVVAWTLATAYSTTAPAANSNYVYANGNIYLCAQTGESVINPNGPGAYLNTGGTLPDNFTAIYSGGQNGDSLILQGSPDGMNWADLEWTLDQSAVFSGPQQIRIVSNASVQFIGALFNKPVLGSLRLILSENNIDAGEASSLVALGTPIGTVGVTTPTAGATGFQITPTTPTAGVGNSAALVGQDGVSGSAGGAVSATGGHGAATGTGGAATVSGGHGGITGGGGTGGAATVSGGAGFTGGGAATVLGGTGTGGGSTGGAASVTGGAGSIGGATAVAGGSGASAGGAVSVTGGAGTSGGSTGGNASVIGGAGTVTGGNAVVDAGTGSTNGTIAIGTVNASALQIGNTGTGTTVYGNPTVHRDWNYLAVPTVVSAGVSFAVTLNDSVGTPIPLIAAQRITLLVPAGGITAGGVLLNYNGTGAVAIKSRYNPATNIATSYVALGIIELIFNGSVWLDLGQ